MRERDTLDFLVADLLQIKEKARPAMRNCVRDGIHAGNRLAQDYARDTSGTHAKKYPGTFTAEMRSNLGLFGNVISGEYGPSHRGQGELARILERGTQNNPSHLNLIRSADRIAASFRLEVGRIPDELFRGFSNPQRSLF